MIELANQRDQDFVTEVSKDWQAASPIHLLEIGGEDFSDRIPQGDVRHDSIALTFNANLIGDLPLRLYGAPISLSLDIGGALVPRIEGRISLPEPNDDKASTKLTAASAGFAADKHPLNERVEYSEVRPDYVVRDALRRLPYLPGSITVQNAESPILSFVRGGEEGPFEKEQFPNDILSKVAEKIPYLYCDTAWGGHKARISSGFRGVPNVPEHMRFHASELIFWKSPTLTLEQYSEVIVWRDNPDGSEAFKPARVEVSYVGRDFPPPIGFTLRIAFIGTDASEAYQRAYEKASELRRGLYKSAPVLPFKPLMERADAFTVTEGKEEEGAFYEREWLHYVDSFEQPWNLDRSGESGFQTKPVCSVTLLNEERVKSPALALALITSGNIKRLWGTSSQEDIMYFDESLSWISTSGDYFTLETGEAVTTAGDYFTVNQ